MRSVNLLICGCALALATLACAQSAPNVIVITATPESAPAPAVPASAAPFPTISVTPTPDPTRAGALAAQPGETYIVAAGDTLSGIAARAGTTIETIARLNQIDNPDALFVGQQLVLPAPPTTQGSGFKIIPDSRLVRAPGSALFDIEAFIGYQPGYIRGATDEVDGVTLTSADIVLRVSLEFSVDARLLLALLEHKSGWLTNPVPDEATRDYPMGAPVSASGFDRRGLYRQLAWAADNLNRGYYGWKRGDLTSIEFEDGARISLAPDLNAGTAGVQFLLSLNRAYPQWERDVAPEGFYQRYFMLIGDPFAAPVDPLVPLGLQPPPMALPFAEGETWYFTGGAHGGWGAGSAWAAVDFAPPDDLSTKTVACYLSDYYATAVASGVIARVDEGVVILDLDGDGDESTGWSVLYLHIATQDRVAVGTQVNTGDRIGRASCEGGFSNGTHIHIARRYNGEWIPAACPSCPAVHMRPPFVLGGWTVVLLPGQEYQGSLVRGSEERVAEQLRGVVENRVSW